MITYIAGELTDIRAQLTETDGAAFSITGVTVTVTTQDGQETIRDEETAEWDSTGQVWYHEDFTPEDDGYAVGMSYLATFSVELTLSGVEYVQKEARVLFNLAAR
jgi:hypothetical protein